MSFKLKTIRVLLCLGIASVGLIQAESAERIHSLSRIMLFDDEQMVIDSTNPKHGLNVSGFLTINDPEQRIHRHIVACAEGRCIATEQRYAIYGYAPGDGTVYLNDMSHSRSKTTHLTWNYIQLNLTEKVEYQDDDGDDDHDDGLLMTGWKEVSTQPALANAQMLSEYAFLTELKKMATKNPSTSGNKPPANGSQLSITDLNIIALALHPGARILETEFDRENGVLVYEVELADLQGIEWDLKINAITGQVIENHRD